MCWFVIYSFFKWIVYFFDSGYSTMDEVSSQLSGLLRPSAKSIYCKLTLMYLTRQISSPVQFIFPNSAKLSFMFQQCRGRSTQHRSTIWWTNFSTEWRYRIWYDLFPPKLDLFCITSRLSFVPLYRSTCSVATWMGRSWEAWLTVWNDWSCWMRWVACGVRTCCCRCAVTTCCSQTSKPRWTTSDLHEWCLTACVWTQGIKGTEYFWVNQCVSQCNSSRIQKLGGCLCLSRTLRPLCCFIL